MTFISYIRLAINSFSQEPQLKRLLKLYLPEKHRKEGEIMFLVPYKETYVRTYEISDDEASNALEAEAYVRNGIMEGTLDGPYECCDSSCDVTVLN